MGMWEGMGAEQMTTSTGSKKGNEEEAIGRIFLGSLKLQPAEEISTSHVCDVYEQTTGHRCRQVVLVSGGEAKRAFEALGAHPMERTVDEVLHTIYDRDFSANFPDRTAYRTFVWMFSQLFNDIASNAAQHAFRDRTGWVGSSNLVGDDVYRAVHDALIMAHYYYFGYSRLGQSAYTDRLRPLVALIDHVAIPFALADGNETLVCLTN